MALARWQATIVDDAGNVLPAASVTVRREEIGAPLASLFSDRDGLVSIGNPFAADGEGFAAFHVAGGSYRITATLGAFTRVWRYVGIGTASELDASDAGIALIQEVDAGYALTFEAGTTPPPGVGAVRFNNASLAAATLAYVSVQNAGGSNIEARLLELFDAAHTVKDTVIFTGPNSNAQASFLITGAVSVGSPAEYVELTLSTHAGATSFTAGQRVNLQRERAGPDGAAGSVALTGVIETNGVMFSAGTTLIKTTMPNFSGDLDTLVTSNNSSSFQKVATGATNTPSGATINGSHVLTFSYDSTAGQQIYLEHNSTRLWKRARNASVWGTWTRLMTRDDVATDADIRSAAVLTTTDAQLVNAAGIESASAGVALTDAATVAVDWDTGINFTLTVTANRAIGNPTNGQPGTWRTILVQGNDGTDRTITFGNQFGGLVPVITDCDSTKKYLLMIFCKSASQFLVTAIDGSDA